MVARKRASARLKLISNGLRPLLLSPVKTPLSHKHGLLAAAMGLTFLVALSVRLLSWHDQRPGLVRDTMPGLSRTYFDEASQIANGGGILIPNPPPDPGDARPIVHPPGYPLLISVIIKTGTDPRKAMRALQVLADCACASFVVLLGAELMPLLAATLAGLIVALSPHLATYCLDLLPDSLVAIPILLMVYLLLSAVRNSSLVFVSAAGLLAGASCWLRADVLLLPAFCALLLVILGRRRNRWRLPAAYLTCAVLVVLPITVRNYLLYRRLIPISVGAGITLAEGISDYDLDGLYGMPRDDTDTVTKDSIWAGKPEYAKTVWSPDGVQRDQERFRRAASVIRSHPFWFLSVMARRAAFMLSFNSPGPRRWPLTTGVASGVSKTPTCGHFDLNSSHESQKVEFDALNSKGSYTHPGSASATPAGSGCDSFVVHGNDSDYDLDFASALLMVKPYTDYMLESRVQVAGAPAAIQIMTPDTRTALGSCSLSPQTAQRQSKKRDTGAQKEVSGEVVLLPFASGRNRAIRIAIRNNGAPAQPLVQVKGLQLDELGPTPYLWTRYPRLIIRAIQDRLYTTPMMLFLILAGVVLLGFTFDRRTLFTLMLVPIYYLITHSVFHLEYRYVLPMYCFLFVAAGFTLYAIWSSCRLLVQYARKRATRLHGSYPLRHPSLQDFLSAGTSGVLVPSSAFCALRKVLEGSLLQCILRSKYVALTVAPKVRVL